MRRLLSRLIAPALAFVAGAGLMAGLRSSTPEAVPGPEVGLETTAVPDAVPGPDAVAPGERVAKPGPSAAESPEPLPDPALVYRLLGTIASRTPGKGRAVVEHLFTGGTAEVTVGDRLAGAEILEIASGRIVLRKPDGEISEIQSQGSTRPTTELPPPPSEIVPGASFVDQLHAERKRELRERFGGDLVANYDNGVLDGWIVVPDPDRDPGRIFEKAGLQPGDRITSLNGMDLTNPETLYHLSQFPVPIDEHIFDVVTPDGTVRRGCEAQGSGP